MNSMNYGILKSLTSVYQCKVSMVHSGETLPYRKWYEKKSHQLFREQVVRFTPTALGALNQEL